MGSCFKFGFRKKNRYDFHNPYSQTAPHGTFRSNSLHAPGWNDGDHDANGDVQMSLENKNAINGFERRNSLDRAPVIQDIKEPVVEVKRQESIEEDNKSVSAKSDHSAHSIEPVDAEPVHVAPPPAFSEPDPEPLYDQAEFIQEEAEPVVESQPSPKPAKKQEDEKTEFTYQTVQISEGAQYGSSYSTEVPEVQVSTVHVGDTDDEEEQHKIEEEPAYATVNKPKKSEAETESETLGDDYQADLTSSSQHSVEEEDNTANEANEEEGHTSVEVNMPPELDELELQSEDIHDNENTNDTSLEHTNTPVELVY